MSTEETKAPSAADIFGGGEIHGSTSTELRFIVTPKGGKPFEVYFSPQDVNTKNRWSDIYNGGKLKKKGDPLKAMQFLFGRKFIRTNIAWDNFLQQASYKDEREFFLNDPRGQLLADAMIDAYLGERAEIESPND